MTRSHGSTLTATSQLVDLVRQLAADGLSQSQIAAKVGRSQAQVSRLLRGVSGMHSHVKAHRLAELVEARKQVNSEGRVAGPRTLAWEMYRQGVPEAEIPSDDTIRCAYNAIGLTNGTVGGKGDKRRYHNVFLNDEGQFGLTGPCQRFQFDFYGPLKVGGLRWYAACMVDCYSRYWFGRLIPHQFGKEIVKFFANALDLMGVPEEVQCDNAFGIRLNRGMLSKAATYLFSRGVQRLHFIPPSQPERAGHIERTNGTQFIEFFGLPENHRAGDGSFIWATIEEAQAAYAVWQCHYNTKRQHQALPLRPGSKRFHLTPSEVHTPIPCRELHPRGGEVAFSRLMSNMGIETAHENYTLALPEFAAKYVMWVCYLNGSGECLHAGKVVANFYHEINQRAIKVGERVLIRAIPVGGGEEYAQTRRVNQVLEQRRLQKNQKNCRPVLDLLPKGLVLLNPYSWDSWHLVDEATGEVILSAAPSGRLPDHVTEEIIFEFS